MIKLKAVSRRAAAGLLVGTLALANQGAGAQPATPAEAWPSRPVTLVVPYAAGSNPDVLGRYLATELAQRLKGNFIVDNVSGAGGAIGTARAAAAKPDGYTFVLGVESTILLAPLVRPTTTRYDGLKDLSPVVRVGTAPLVLVGKPELPARNLAELLALIRAKPDGFSYGTSGIGTSLHLAGELFMQSAGVSMQHIPYAVSTQIMTDLQGNQLDLAVLPAGSVLQHLRAGKLKAYAVTTASRSPLLPDVPTAAEQAGVKPLDVSVWFGVFAPAGAPAPVMAQMQQALMAALTTEEARKRLQELGIEAAPAPADAFARFLVTNRDQFARLITAKKINLE